MISLLPEFGIGIEMTKHSLMAVVAKTLWGKIQIVDELEIDDLENRSAAACGEIYRQFLKRNGLESPWTVVAIPREAFLYRERQLPANVIPELQSVMAMQIDALHPFGSEEIVWDSTAEGVVGGKSVEASPASGASQPAVTVSTGIARKEAVETLAEWFEVRGIPVSQFAASTLLLKNIANAAVTSGNAPAGPIAIAYVRDTSWELAGTASSGTSSTRVFHLEAADVSESSLRLVGEIERLFADLRLNESTQPALLIGGDSQNLQEVVTEIGHAPSLHTQVKTLQPRALAEAAARVSVGTNRASALNLLPENRRRFVPSMSLAPTYVLAGLVVLLCLALGVRGTVQDWLYSRRLDSEIRSLQPRITEIESIRGRERETYNRILRLVSIRNGARIPLEVIEDLTQVLPKDAWLQGLQMDGNAVTLSGSAASASGVLQAISQAKTVESPQFLSAISRSNTGEESFRIGAKLKNGMQ